MFCVLQPFQDGVGGDAGNLVIVACWERMAERWLMIWRLAGIWRQMLNIINIYKKRIFFFPEKEAKNAMKIYDLNIPSGSSNLSNSLTFWFQLHSYCGRNLF